MELALIALIALYAIGFGLLGYVSGKADRQVADWLLFTLVGTMLVMAGIFALAGDMAMVYLGVPWAVGVLIGRWRKSVKSRN